VADAVIGAVFCTFTAGTPITSTGNMLRTRARTPPTPMHRWAG